MQELTASVSVGQVCGSPLLVGQQAYAVDSSFRH